MCFNQFNCANYVIAGFPLLVKQIGADTVMPGEKSLESKQAFFLAVCLSPTSFNPLLVLQSFACEFPF